MSQKKHPPTSITEMNIEKIIMENHPHKVWQNKNGRWVTYVNDGENGRRRQISSKSKKKLLEMLNQSTLEEYKDSNVPTIRNCIHCG